MRLLLKIALAAALVVISMAGAGGVTTAAPTGSVEGSVWADDGDPIRGALVQVCSWDTGLVAGEARTASDGRYSVGGLAFNRYRVSAEAEGYFRQDYKDGAPRGVMVAPPGATDNIDFILTPGSSISGYIYQADGRTPLPGARVAAYQDGGAAWGYAGIAYADASGFYSLTLSAAGGTYRVGAEAAGFGAEHYVAFWDSGEATDIRLSSLGHRAGVDINLDPVGYVSGTVYDAGGLVPVAAGHVVAFDNATGVQVAEGFCEARAGTYYVNLSPGTYRLKAEAEGYLAEWYLDAARFSAASPVSVVDLEEEGSIDFTLTPVLEVRTYLASFPGAGVRLNGRLVSLGAGEDCTTSFIWGAAPGSYAHETPRTLRDSTGFFSCVLEGLEPGKVYYYRARAAGDGGPVYGEESHFKVPDREAPAMARLNLDITATAVVLTWTTREPAFSRIDFGLTDEYGSSTGQSQEMVTSFNVTLLVRPDSAYHYRIVLRDSSGNRWESGDLTFDTPAYYGGRNAWPWKVLGFAIVGLVAVALGFVWARSR